jgi:hypothetical protein
MKLCSDFSLSIKACSGACPSQAKANALVMHNAMAINTIFLENTILIITDSLNSF